MCVRVCVWRGSRDLTKAQSLPCPSPHPSGKTAPDPGGPSRWVAAGGRGWQLGAVGGGSRVGHGAHLACLSVQARASVKYSRVGSCPGEPAQAIPQPAGQKTEDFPPCSVTQPRAAAGVSWTVERRCLGPVWPGASWPVRVSRDPWRGSLGWWGVAARLFLFSGWGGLPRHRRAGAGGRWLQLILMMPKHVSAS